MNVERNDVKDKYQELVEQAIATLQANGKTQQLAALSICDDMLSTLKGIETNVLEAINSGLIEYCEQITAEKTTPGTPERIVLELVSEATKGLTQSISEAFVQHRDVVKFQRDRFVLGKIKPKLTSSKH